MNAVVEGFMLSPQQTRLWRLQMGGPAAAFRAACVLRPAAPLDAELLQAALRDAVRRNEILRTDFQQIPGMELPLQVIAGEREPTFARVDLPGCPSAEQEKRIESLFQAMAGEDSGGLRAVLIDGQDGQRLLLDVPALCADTAGLVNLAGEVEGCYQALLRNGQPEGQPVQYADVASWLTELLEGQDPRARRYWQARDFSHDLTAVLPFARPAQGGRFDPRRLDLPIPLATAGRLANLARDLGTPVPDLLLTGWSLLLQRLTERGTVVVGTAFDGRRHEELKGALGLFMRYLPVSFAAPPGASFVETARDLAGTLAELAEWQELFAWNGEGGGASDGEPPFFSFGFESVRLGGGGLLAIERCHASCDRFELKLAWIETPDGFRAELHYDAAALRHEDVARVGEWLLQLLASAVERPGAAAGELEILTARDRERWRELNDTAFDFGPAKSLAQRFEEQADLTPDRIAIAFRDRTLTYAELEERSNRLARRLRGMGVGPDQRVPLCIERSLEMVIGILGILKAGGAYVPVDPAYPESRRAFMLADANSPVVLTEEKWGDSMPAGSRVLRIDLDAPGIEAEDPRRLSAASAPDNLAYVIYTSGSTGQPKGVMISHRAISNRLLWHQRAFPLAADDRLLQKTPYSFDAAVWEIFLPLLTGAQLVMAEPGGHQDAAYLADAVARHGVTVLQLVPSVLAVLLEEPRLRERCHTLRRLFCGGEAYPAELAQRCRELLDVEICNLYGPTEVSIDASFHAGPAESGESVVPIGQPLDNAGLHLLDVAGRRVPPGWTGELHVSGPGLARGYMGRPELTAERFVPNAFGAVPGERLYRTGDRARLAPTGEVHFLGRIDQQVKIRGFRIEPGEIEAVLQQHPSVRGAAVILRQEAGDPRLVAYAVPAREADLEPGELREFLVGRLPEHMVPVALVILDELPRLPNGKVDRAALPDPEAARLESGPPFVAPRTPVEEILAGIWTEVLTVDRVGARDDFFQLGGHSLIATRVISRVREAFRVDLPVRTLFEAPTVAALAEAVERTLKAADGLLLPPIERVSRDRTPPLSFSQQRLWFLQQLEPESHAYNIPAALRLTGRLDRGALERSLADIRRRHEVLRTTFSLVDGEPVQIIHPSPAVAVPVVDLAGLPPEAREHAVLETLLREAVRPFDLGAGPLLRAHLLRLGDREHVISFNLHHVVSDGWSVGILVRELSALYAGHAAGRAAELPPLAIQYADFAWWQRQWLQGATLESQLSYWRQRLAGAPGLLNLATDRPRPPVQTYRGATCGRWLGRDLAESLRRLGRGASVTLFTTLLTAFKALLQRYGAGDDIVVGTNVANRNHVDLEGLIGFFVNSLVLRTGLRSADTFRQTLAGVRETVLGAFTHQDLPFDRVVEELQPRRDLSVTPLFQVVFDMDPNGKGPGLALPGLEVVPLSMANRTAKFDLNLTLEDREEGLLVAAEYSVDLLDRATVERLLKHFEALLQEAATAPDLPLRDLRLLDEAEELQLLSELQGKVRDYPHHETFQTLFERQCAATPDQIAVVDSLERITYRELNRRADRLAAILRRLGARPGDFTGILEERGVDFLTAMLAIFKAGGAYVPFEPGYPADRLLYMIGNSGISILITRPELAADRLSGLGDGAELRSLVLLGESGGTATAVPGGLHVEPFDPRALGDAAAIPPVSGPRDPAYMLYTSGSTGLPKGAVIRHDGAINHIYAQFEALELGPGLYFLQSAPSSSDISVWQFLAPLLIGGRTVIADLETVSDPARLLRLLRQEEVTIAELVPAVLRGLLDHVSELPVLERRLPALRWMMATGEAVPVALINDWFAFYPEIRAVNAYGPTEASDDVTQLILDGPLPPGVHSLSIGRPLANFSCHIVDRELSLVPLGVPGELCIAGIGVGLGYWRNPEKTSQSFVPNPFASTSGEVLYRTGDLARWMADGNLEFLGRIDHQVKIRGFRIELGEIEAVLREHGAVQDCVVVVRDDPGAGKRLIAYIAVREGEGLEPGELRELLQGKLPGHMMPAAFVILPALPRTPNGKIDRRALPAPERAGSAGSSFTAPRNRIEQKLAGIWAEVFRLEQVDIHADFFALGGHSLLAVRVLARVQAEFAVQIPLRQVFDQTTVATFAKVVERASQEAPGAAPPTIGRVARQVRRLSQTTDF